MRQHDETDNTPFADETFERAVRELRRPVRVHATLFDARVMDEVLRAPTGMREQLESFLRPRTFRVSPLIALAAGLLFAVSIAGSVLYVLPSRERGVQSARVAQGEVARAASGSPLVQFGFAAPHASSVALVGDFNNWDPQATPLRAASTGGVWSVEVPIQPGRHLYAFVVDGTVWRPDPAAPPATGEDFGEPNSSLTVADPGMR
ncbi:MAG: isoamylase early set domain-containing protein [Gemmatimonadota bacterium]|nr:isoamylase early set domain-containing protein [Gemmatimonadota bacterium]